MAFDSRVYRILIASPSDVEEEREIAVRVIQEWNDLYSYSRKVVLLPLRWETHTAPEYGTRPQEIINKAIVDQCDLLVGIFWTRIGSPTEVADSGTLEEIERVGIAGKPIMLYFSKVAIDPDKIDTAQIEKLKEFKIKSYPKGLVEKYKTIIEFRDKFAKQIELKIRDLQKNERSGVLPISLNFLSLEDNKLIGSPHCVTQKRPIVDELDQIPIERQEEVSELLKVRINQLATIPVALAIDNSSSSGIRNLYVEIDITSTTKDVTLSDTKKSTAENDDLFYRFMWVTGHNETNDPKYAKFESEKLIKTSNGWRLSFDWDAIQPQRTRLIKPILFLLAQESTSLSIKAKVFADSFPEPLYLTVEMKLNVIMEKTSLDDIIPDWPEFLVDNKGKPRLLRIPNG